MASTRPLLALSYKTGLGVPFLVTFIFPRCVEGASRGLEVRWLYLLACGTENKGHKQHKGLPPALSAPSRPQRRRFHRRSGSFLGLEQQSPVASQGLQRQRPAPVSPVGTQTYEAWRAFPCGEPLQAVCPPPPPSRHMHNIISVHTTYAAYHLYEHSHICVHTHGKAFTQ